MATWASGVNFKNSNNTTNIGGIGIYGNNTTAEKLYIGLGTEPWNNAGIQLTSSAINFKGHKIYHAGDKPSHSDVGAAPASHTHSVLTGINDTRATEYSPATARNDFKVTFQQSKTNGMSDGGDFYSLVHMPRWGNSSGGYGSQIALTDNENIWYRKGTSDTAWTGWKKIWHSGNFDPNTKFQSGGTYGTLYLTDWFRAKGNTGLYFQDYGGGWYMTDSTWVRSYAGKNIYTDGIMNAKNGFQWNGQSLDSRYAATTHSHSYLPLSGGTLTGAVTFANNTYNIFGDDVALGDCNQAGKIGIKGLNGQTGIYFYPQSGSVAQTISIDGTGSLTISGTTKGTFNGSLTGNASTATKLAASKTIALSGDATGSASFDGSANATINATVRKTCLVGSDAETAAGWYKVASQTMSGYGNTNITFAVTSTYSNYHSGILQLQIRSDNTSISCHRLAWHTRIGLSTSHYVVNISGMTWTLYAYQSNRHARLMFEVMSQSSIDNKNASFALNNTSTKESATPTATVTSSDAATVATANTLTTARNITIGNTKKSFNGSGDVTWNLTEIGAAASSHTHTTSQITDATSNNIANTIVKRDGSGNISVGTIAGSLSGNATTATTLQTPRIITIGRTGKSFNGNSNVSWSHNEMKVPRTNTYYAFGGNENAITTEQFITLLTNAGAFEQEYWISRGSWSYAGNQYITDTGCGNIHLAGCTVEVIGNTSAYTIRIHTPTTSARGVTNGDFIYVNNGSSYSPGWRRLYNDKYKPTPTDIGAASASHNHDSSYLKLTGGTMTGNLTLKLGGSTLSGAGITTGNTQLIGTDTNIIYFGNPKTKLRLESVSNPEIYVNGANYTLYHAGNKPSYSDIGAASASHNHDVLISAGGRIASANIAAKGDKGLRMYLATSSMTTGKPANDGFILNFDWDTTVGWSSQMYIRNSNNPILQLRGMQEGTWGSWYTVYSTNNKPKPSEIGAAETSHTHTNYVQTSDYSLKTISKTLTIGTSWMDTGITGTDLASGSYMVQVSGMSSSATSFYSEIWTGVMSWYSADTNSTDSDEIVLHKAGHASNGRTIYLRTLRVEGNKTLKLQICASTTLTSTNITFRFRKLI